MTYVDPHKHLPSLDAAEESKRAALDRLLGGLGVTTPTLYDEVKAAVERFLADRGYAPEEAWVGSIRWGRVEVCATDIVWRYIRVDEEALTQAVKGISSELDVCLRRMRRNGRR